MVEEFTVHEQLIKFSKKKAGGNNPTLSINLSMYMIVTG